MTGLISSINIKFLNILANNSSTLGTGSSKSGLGAGAKSEDAVKTSLRNGAQTYSFAVRGLSTLGSYLNLAKDSMEKLDNLTDKMITIVEEAKKSSTSSQSRANLDLRYERLVKDFKAITEAAIAQDQNFLTTDGLNSLFQMFGLDKNESESITELFSKFKTPSEDTSLASEEIEGPRPILIPEEAFTVPVPVTRQKGNYDGLFDTDRHINKRPEAYRVDTDLKALKEQITRNRHALDQATEVVISNIKLAQGAGYAFLEASNEGADSPEAAAELVRQKIRQNVPAALAQADNLQPMAIAALILAKNGAYGSGKG